jgi:uncharacterized damage-inducible protein DinB
MDTGQTTVAETAATNGAASVAGRVAGRTIAQVIPWAKTFLQYTDDVINDLPEDDAALDYRQVDPAGGYVFSVREQAMHIADTRHSAIGWLTGNPEDDDDFCTDYGGTDKPWLWKSASRDEIIARNKAGREKVEAWMNKPADAMFEVTAKTQQSFDEANAKLTAEGKDISERLARGPAPVINTLLFIVAHELGHRAMLQHLLRMSGHKVTRYA